MKNLKTIILNIIHVDSFIHELGQWYHSNFLPNLKNKKDVEGFANKFETYLIKEVI